MEKVVAIPIDTLWQIFWQVVGVIGCICGIIIGCIAWFGRRTLGLMDKLVETSGHHSVRIEVHETRIDDHGERISDAENKIEAMREKLFIVTYPKQSRK